MTYIPTSAYEPGFPAAWEGLDLNSAEEATPRWYGVSFGNGNDGVSHMWPAYYVRTCEPYTLALAAMLGEFKPGEGHEWALEHTEVDGEADYTISAVIYKPPDDNSDMDHSACEDGEDCEGCDMCEPDSDYCSANGAWMICEVFPVEADTAENISAAPSWYSLDEALSADVVTLARDSEG